MTVLQFSKRQKIKEMLEYFVTLFFCICKITLVLMDFGLWKLTRDLNERKSFISFLLFSSQVWKLLIDAVVCLA